MIEFPFENISDAVLFHSERTPQEPALILGRESLSYAQLAAQVLQAADYLHNHLIRTEEIDGEADEES